MLLFAVGRRPATLLRVVGLGLVSWTVITSNHAPGLHGRGLVVLVTLVLTALGWVTDLVRRLTGRITELGTDDGLRPELAVVALAGGFLCGACPSSAAAVFPFVAVVGSALRVEAAQTLVVTAFAIAGVCAGFIGYRGGTLGMIAYGLGLLAATFAASSARQRNVRTEQAELLLAQAQRTHEEQLRAARLEESSRLAREIHDVLAHSLAGLSIQLEATAALVEQGVDRDTVLARVRRAHELALDGLRETRRAVGALRGEPVAGLRERLDTLVAEARATGDAEIELVLRGNLGGLGEETGHAILRTVQEGLTNAAKHAPGAPVSVLVEMGDGVLVQIEDRASDRVAGRVSDPVAVSGPPARLGIGELAGSGGGFGLRGMRERAEALRGSLSVGPTAAGWRVELRLPADREPGPGA